MDNKLLELAYMSIEGMNEADRKVLYSCVAPERREQLMARKNRQSADLSLAGEVLARVMLWQTVRRLEAERPGVIQPKDFVIVRDEYGKPYQETVPGLFFNISHSGTMVACAIAGENIGIDIQKRAEGVKVREKVFCPEELREVCNAEESGTADSPCLFTELWTKKESYLKLTGEGLRRDMTSLCVRKMQEDGAAQWFGGWVTEEYCMYACAQGCTKNAWNCNSISLEELKTKCM